MIKWICIIMLFVVGVVNAATNKVSKISFTYENEVQVKSQSSPFYYDHNDIQAKYLINKYLDVFTDYRLILQDKGNGFKSQSMFIEGFKVLKN